MAVNLMEGDSSYPTLSKLYEFFSPRSSKLTIWSFGLGYGGIETDLIESTGSTVQVFDAREPSQGNFATIQRILESHTTIEGDPEWTASLPNKWIQPSKLTLSTALPWYYDGAMVVNGVSTSFSAISFTSVPRVDICKIDYPGLTYQIVYMLLTTGYRPGLLYIRWDEHPDEDVAAMLCAGHLQSSGYEMMKESGGFFLYRYIDECLYESCSWARSDCKNPMIAELTSPQQ